MSIKTIQGSLELAKDIRDARIKIGLTIEEAAHIAAPAPEEHPEVSEALAKLAPGDRAAVYLFYYEQLPTKEIASILRMTDSAVRKRLSRARRELQILLGGEADGR